MAEDMAYTCKRARHFYQAFMIYYVLYTIPHVWLVDKCNIYVNLFL